jgi:hypothetical protein
VPDGLHIWIDTWTLENMSNLKGINDKIGGNDKLMQTVET